MRLLLNRMEPCDRFPYLDNHHTQLNHRALRGWGRSVAGGGDLAKPESEPHWNRSTLASTSWDSGSGSVTHSSRAKETL